MSFLLACQPSEDCEEGVSYPGSHYQALTSDITGVSSYYQDGDINDVKYNSSSYSGSGSLDEGSYDEDRPQSRLTIIESPTPSFDQDTEDLSQLSHFSLESPEPADEYYSGSDRLPATGHTCDECLKTFSSPGKLKQHEYSHTGETPFECKISGCDKKFTSKFKLKRHILIHSQTKTFLCDVCHRAFRRKDHLKNHEKVHDPGKTVYSCNHESCGRTYNSLSSFRKHQAMHSAEDGQLDCKICKVVLSSRDELINHLKVHAGSRTVKGAVDKKFMCEQCEKKFFTRKDLKRHSVVHTGNREFSCPHCTQRFGRKDHMTRHAKKTHPSLWEGSSTSTSGRSRHASSQSGSTSTVERSRFLSTPAGSQPPPPLRPLRTTRKERSISDPGPLRSPDPGQGLTGIASTGDHGLVLGEETRLIGLPRNVIVHHNSERGIIEESKCHVYSGGSVSYCADQFPGDISPPGGDFLDLDLDTRTERMVIKEEDETDYYDKDDSSLGDLLGVPGVRDMNLGSLMQEFGDKSIDECSGSGSGDQDAMMTDEEMLIKMEPTSPPVSPIPHGQDDSLLLTSMIVQHQQQPPVSTLILTNPPQELSLIAVTSSSSPALVDTSQLASLDISLSKVDTQLSKARSIFLRTPSQDSITRTKNPVLPSIHTESCLVVPEPNTVKYPPPSNLLFSGEEREVVETLTELKGSLFMDEYGQQYNLHQPWN